MRITHDKADLPCGEEEEMMRLMNNTKDNGLTVVATVAIIATIDALLPKDSDKLRLPKRGGTMPPVEPPASALRTTLHAPLTLVPDTHGASDVKMHKTVPTTTTSAAMRMEQAADNAAADSSHNREAKRKATLWRPSTARWSRRTFPNFQEDLQRFPTLLPWSWTKKNGSSLMSRLPM